VLNTQLSFWCAEKLLELANERKAIYNERARLVDSQDSDQTRWNVLGFLMGLVMLAILALAAGDLLFGRSNNFAGSGLGGGGGGDYFQLE
jgi:hypothetical protein